MAHNQCDCTLPSEGFYDMDSVIYSDSADSDEMDCSDPLAMSYRCDMHEGIRLEMWTHQPKMRQLVNVIVALKRMKMTKPKSSEFGQREVFNMLFENAIEVVDAPPSYNKTDHVLQCTICDQYKKSLVRSGLSPYLQAVTLKAGNINYKVNFSMSTYVSASANLSSSQPVCLGISKSNLYLACNPPDHLAPQLVLKEISGSLKTIKAGDPNDNLLFFRKQTGTSTNTFESVKYPGWFISTALDDSQTVEMDQNNPERITNFELEKKI